MRQKRKIMIWTRKSQHSNMKPVQHETRLTSATGNNLSINTLPSARNILGFLQLERLQTTSLPWNPRLSDGLDLPSGSASLWSHYKGPYDPKTLTSMKTSLKNRLRILLLFFTIILRVQLLKRGEFGLELKRRDRGLVQTQVVEFITLPFPFPNKLKFGHFTS